MLCPCICAILPFIGQCRFVRETLLVDSICTWMLVCSAPCFMRTSLYLSTHSCTNPTSTSTAISPLSPPYPHLLHIRYTSARTFSAPISTIRVYVYTPPRIVGKEQVTRDARACEAEEKRTKQGYGQERSKRQVAQSIARRKVVTQNFGRVRVGLKSKMLSGCTCQGITHKQRQR